MRYGGRLNRIEFTALIDQHANRIRASAAALPLYGPAGWTGPCRIGMWGWEDDRLMHAGLMFGDPTINTAWIEVVTTAAPPLPLLIDIRMAASGESPPADRRTYERNLRAASSPAPQRIGIAVDGMPKPFHYWPDQPLATARDQPREPVRDQVGERPAVGWLAVLDEVPGLLLRVSGLTPAEVHLARVADVEPHLAGTRAQLLAGYDAYGAQ